MAHSEQRQYIYGNQLLVTCDIAVVMNDDEVYHPGGENLHKYLRVQCAQCEEKVDGEVTQVRNPLGVLMERENPVGQPVPTDRQEVVFGVIDVKYKVEEEWVSLDVNIADLIAENVALRERCDQQQRELNVARRQMQLFRIEEEGADASGTGGGSSAGE